MIKPLLLVTTCLLAMTGILFLRRINFPTLTNLSVDSILNFLTQPNLWIGTFFSGVAFLFYLWVLTKYETSSVVPALLGINLVIISIFSIVFFQEALTLTKIGAYGLIFGGMWLLL